MDDEDLTEGIDLPEPLPVATMGDPFLASIARLAEGSTEMNVTVWVGGMVLYGTVVGHARYLRAVANLSFDGTGNLHAGLASELWKGAQQADENAAAARVDPDDFPDPIHLHLLDAHAWTGAGAVAVPGPIRMRISEVAAFMLGAPAAAVDPTTAA